MIRALMVAAALSLLLPGMSVAQRDQQRDQQRPPGAGAPEKPAGIPADKAKPAPRPPKTKIMPKISQQIRNWQVASGPPAGWWLGG